MAAVVHNFSEYGRLGSSHLPRSHRALKGWRKRTPPRSRAPHCLAYWAMIIWDFCRRGYWLMAIYLCWMLACYTRPKELLSVQVQDLQRPVPGVSNHWHINLFPESRTNRSKVLASDDSLELSCAWMPFLAQTAEVLAQGPKTSLLFNFTYADFLVQWKATGKRLGLTAVPYQARHSGPSIDAARGLRTRIEIKTRGRWSSDKSVLRYEKKARLMQSFNTLSDPLQLHAVACEGKLAALMAGSLSPDCIALPRPSQLR